MSTLTWRKERQQVSAETWLSVLRDEYLRDYLPSGGSTVKFISGTPATLEHISTSVLATATSLGYYVSHLEPAKLGEAGKKPDLHRIDRFFFETTREIDWKDWAETHARHYLETLGIDMAAARDLHDIDGIARSCGREPADLLNQFQREYATALLRDHALAIEYRTALAELGRAQLIPTAMTPTTEEVLLGWFRGRTIPGAAAALKRIRVFGRIDTSNARFMLTSLCRWLPRTGRSGLVVVLDFRPYEHRRVSKAKRRIDVLAELERAIARGVDHTELGRIAAEAEAEPPVSYSNQAYDQMLQLLRRFIDEIDDFERLCLVVLTSPSYYDDASERNYTDYAALQTRIGLEVHDAVKANPAAALVHLEESK